jgi:hypothetical protein
MEIGGVTHPTVEFFQCGAKETRVIITNNHLRYLFQKIIRAFSSVLKVSLQIFWPCTNFATRVYVAYKPRFMET